jgi:hypothetical protein
MISGPRSKIDRILDYPVSFLIFSGGEGGDFISNLINRYKGVDWSMDGSSAVDRMINRTQTFYPSILKEATAWPQAVSFRSRNELAESLEAKGLLTGEHIERAERYLTMRPVLRTHEANPNLFSNYTSSFFISSEAEREYCLVLMNIKHQFPKETAIDDFLALQLSFGRPLKPRYPLEEIRACAQDHPGLSIEAIRLRTLLVGLGPEPESVEWAFNQPLRSLHEQYRAHYHPSFASYQRQIARQMHQSRGPVHELAYDQVILQPGYLAQHFGIAQITAFDQELSQWHQTNLSLMQASGFDPAISALGLI